VAEALVDASPIIRRAIHLAQQLVSSLGALGNKHSILAAGNEVDRQLESIQVVKVSFLEHGGFPAPVGNILQEGGERRFTSPNGGVKLPLQQIDPLSPEGS
jgi:hypothetical protein